MYRILFFAILTRFSAWYSHRQLSRGGGLLGLLRLGKVAAVGDLLTEQFGLLEDGCFGGRILARQEQRECW